MIDRLAFLQQERMYQALVKQTSLAPRLTISKIILYVLSLFVHLSTLFLVAWGVYVLVSGEFDLGRLLIGGLLLLLAWAFRPRLGRLVDEDYLTRDKYPTLFSLIDRVAELMGVKTPQLVTYDAIFNAFFGRIGFRQRSWLHLGMALWMSLSPRARIALLAHELAHDANGDSARGLWVGGAFQTIIGWYQIIVPDQVFSSNLSPFEIIFYFLLYLLSRPIYFLIWLYILLLMYDSRRAEYLADELASRVVGTVTMIELHRHMPQQNPNEISPLLLSHPSGEYRIRFLKDRPQQSGQIYTTEAEMRRIDAELADVYKKMSRELGKLGVVEY